jgi:hypothetical protein
MKTSRSAPECIRRFSIYGERAMPQNHAEKGAAKRTVGGVLKRAASAISRSERLVSRACRRISKALTPLVGRAKYAANSKAAKLQAAMARASSGSSRAQKTSGAAAQHVAAYRPESLTAAQLACYEFLAVDNIKKLLTEFSATDSDVPAAIGAMNEFSKSLRESGVDLHDVTYDQVTTFLEKAQASDTPSLSPKARDFLLRAQSTAPETLEIGPLVTYPEQ